MEGIPHDLDLAARCAFSHRVFRQHEASPRTAPRRVATRRFASQRNATRKRTYMKTVVAHLKSISPYSQSKHYVVEKLQGESPDDHYRRTWRNHMHFDKEGMTFIPPGAFKNCLSEAAKFMSISIPGKGKATYTKNFEAGVLALKPMMLGIHRDQVECESLFLPSDGRRGGPKRVDKYYPFFPEWEGPVEFHVVDETVLQTMASDKNKTIFEHVLEGGGQFIGIGRFRPRMNGWYGRYKIKDFAIMEA